MKKNEEEKLFEKELENIKSEKDKIRKILDAAGAKNTSRISRIINVFLIILAIVIILLDILKYIYKFKLPYISVDSLLSIVVLIVCVKILISLHAQMRINHFQFWILNSLEFKINDISKKVNSLEKNTHKEEKSFK